MEKGSVYKHPESGATYEVTETSKNTVKLVCYPPHIFRSSHVTTLKNKEEIDYFKFSFVKIGKVFKQP